MLHGVDSSGVIVPDENRVVDLSDDADGAVDDEPVLPASTRDDTDAGWGERPRDNVDWLIEQRPPHWD